MMAAFGRMMGRLAAALALLALVAVGGAHRGASAAPAPIDAGLAAFLASGGSFDDLCLTDHGGGERHGDCPACVLAKAFAALPPPVALPIRRTHARARAARVADRRRARHRPQAPPGRGPPAVRTI